jgi:hypothetical protein
VWKVGCDYTVSLILKHEHDRTYYSNPAKLFEMKLSFVPKEKNEAVLLMSGRYWMECGYDVTHRQTSELRRLRIHLGGSSERAFSVQGKLYTLINSLLDAQRLFLIYRRCPEPWNASVAVDFLLEPWRQSAWRGDLDVYTIVRRCTLYILTVRS